MASTSGFAPPKLADFILTERLGSGTYATVYKAYRKVSLWWVRRNITCYNIHVQGLPSSEVPCTLLDFACRTWCFNECERYEPLLSAFCSPNFVWASNGPHWVYSQSRWCYKFSLLLWWKVKVQIQFLTVTLQGDTREVVAVKVVGKKTLNKSSTENLLTEIEILKTMRHPHIVQLKDFQVSSF